MKSLRYIVIMVMLIVLGPARSFAQNTSDNPDFIKAYNCMMRNSLDSARTFMDKAITDTGVRRYATSWYVRGFIYKELYKKYEAQSKKSTFRDTSTNSLIKSVKIDTTDANKKECYPTLKYLAATYYNDASNMMDSLHYATAMAYYYKYKQITKQIDPANNQNATDVSFNLKLGEVYSYLSLHTNDDKQRQMFCDSAKKADNRVLAINPNDVSANYSLAILFYNQAVYIINQMDYDADISKLNAAQDTSVHLAMQSLPFMQKTYQLDPKKKDAVKGLEGIYYLLHDTQKFEEYEQKLKELEGQN